MIYIVLADGFEEVEALTPYNLMRRAGLNVKLVALDSMKPRGCTLALGVECDITMQQALESEDKIELLMFPGGMPGAANCDSHPLTDALINKAIADGAYLAAICAAPMIFGKRGLLSGKRATAFPSFREYLEGAVVCDKEKVCTDGRFITAAGMGAAFEFGIEILRALCSEQVAMSIKERVQG
ncbi:MAG: DJ-1/PfpI family protein [Clostridia bacterium]|nr:DJ-1/PfpI family protein [Clostridia bacterium]